MSPINDDSGNSPLTKPTVSVPTPAPAPPAFSANTGNSSTNNRASKSNGNDGNSNNASTLILCPYAKKPKRKIFRWVMLILILVVVIGAIAAPVLEQKRAMENKANRIALVNLQGVITTAQSELEWIRTVREDDTISGVLVRIESPGGAVVGSQELYAALKSLDARKPVVVSVGNMAASGGYYAAVAGRYIVANPSSVVGSIGVKMELANMEGLVEKIGIRFESLTSGALKNAGSPFQQLTEKERQYFLEIVNNLYMQFVKDIAAGRKLDVATVQKLADGRIYTGEQALALKLVDYLGDYDTAARLLHKEMGGVTEPEYIKKPEKDESFIGKYAPLLGAGLAQLEALPQLTAGPRFFYIY